MRILFLCAASLLSGIYMACYSPDLIPMAFLFVACYVSKTANPIGKNAVPEI